MNDLERMEALLAEYRQKCEELEIAIRVLSEIRGVSYEKPLVTIRRVVSKPNKKKAAEFRERVTEVLQGALEPMSSGEVIRAVFIDNPAADKKEKDRVYWTLKDFRDKGFALYENGRYRWVKPPDG